MRKLGECEDSVSPVIGVILMLGLTVIMASLIAVSVFSFKLPENAPHARIVVVEAKGGLPSFGAGGASFENNSIKIKHKGGDPLDINNTKIIITGYGQSHTPCPNPCPYVPQHPNIGNVHVIYTDLTTKLKDHGYKNKNPSILDGEFSAGELLLLSGDDKKSSSDDESSVITVINGDTNTSNKYAFKEGTPLQIIFIDTPTNQIIATSRITVRHP